MLPYSVIESLQSLAQVFRIEFFPLEKNPRFAVLPNCRKKKIRLLDVIYFLTWHTLPLNINLTFPKKIVSSHAVEWRGESFNLLFWWFLWQRIWYLICEATKHINWLSLECKTFPYWQRTINKIEYHKCSFSDLFHEIFH